MTVMVVDSITSSAARPITGPLQGPSVLVYNSITCPANPLALSLNSMPRPYITPAPNSTNATASSVVAR